MLPMKIFPYECELTGSQYMIKEEQRAAKIPEKWFRTPGNQVKHDLYMDSVTICWLDSYLDLFHNKVATRGRGRGQNQRGRGTGSAPWLVQRNQPGGSSTGSGRG